jgi:F420 biosynthesis protein FbiB-like protein
MDYQDLLELVKKRRSIRRFRPDPVSYEDVERIVEVARWAPSGANSQPWEMVVVRQPELKDAIIDILREHSDYTRKVELTRDEEIRHAGVSRPWSRPGYADAPVFILICGDPRTQEAYPLSARLNHGDEIFASSLASALLYMHLAATSLGLGSQWVSASSDHFAQRMIKQLLDIPQEMEIYDMMALGYPAREPGPRLVRDREDLIHKERYDRARFRSAGEVRDFILQLRRERTGRP